MKYKILFVLALALAIFESHDYVQAIEPPANIHAFILLGQSNMVGHSTIPTIQQVSNFGFDWINNNWQIAVAPLFDGGQYGPANQFIVSVISVKGESYPVGVIPCAVDSTQAADWEKNKPIYARCINMIYAAQNSGASIAGILISQGEANTSTQALADEWLSVTPQYLYDLMDDYGDTSHLTPVVIAQLGYDPQTNPYWTYLHNIQPQIINGRPTWRMVQTDDLGKKSDNLHFTTTSNIIIGQRFASQWCALTAC